jgi:hypothetical protein
LWALKSEVAEGNWRKRRGAMPDAMRDAERAPPCCGGGGGGGGGGCGGGCGGTVPGGTVAARWRHR